MKRYVLALLLFLFAACAIAQVVMLQRRPSPVVSSDWYPSNLSGIMLWHAAYTLTGTNDGDAITQWIDLSGSNCHSYSSGSPPVLTNNVVNSRSGVWFSNLAFVTVSNRLGGLTAAEVFIVARGRDDPTSVGVGSIYDLDGSGNTSHIPFTSGTVYDTFCSSSRYTTANPADSLANIFLYNAQATTWWSNRINGALLWGTSPHTFAVPSQGELGNQLSIGHASGNGYCGYIFEFILYSRILTESERDLVESYCNRIYGMSIP